MTLNHYVGADMMSRWGWRIPFIVGCLILPCLFWIRRMLEENHRFYPDLWQSDTSFQRRGKFYCYVRRRSLQSFLATADGGAIG